MENVLDVYKRPYSADYPVVCMDETPRQLIRETRAVITMAPGRPERHDYEYQRCGVYNVLPGERTTGRPALRQGDRTQNQE